MNLMAIYGAGLLVGAVLIVIIPEGLLVLIASLNGPVQLNKHEGNSSAIVNMVDAEFLSRGEVNT
jgi:hypothetical protein